MRLVRERGGGEIHINVDEIDTDTRRFYERHGFVNIKPVPTTGCSAKSASYDRHYDPRPNGVLIYSSARPS
jgi:hypothetical protein